MPEPIEASWLAVRRAADELARAASVPLIEQLAAHLTSPMPEDHDHDTSRGPSAAASDDIPRRIAFVDVGAGTGANQEWLGPQVQQRMGHAWAQDWNLLDHDASLLAQARPSSHEWLPDTTRHVGGVEEVGIVLGRLHRSRVVTCSALLDLLTADQIDSLVRACVAGSEGALLSLSVTGEVRLDPQNANDTLVADLFNRHQRGGDARNTGTDGDSTLGPDGWHHAERAFEAAGWTVELATTAWRLGPDDEALTRRLLTERAGAARRATDDREKRQQVDAWLAGRLGDIDADQLRMSVDHVDVLALPPSIISVQTSSPRA